MKSRLRNLHSWIVDKQRSERHSPAADQSILRLNLKAIDCRLSRTMSWRKTTFNWIRGQYGASVDSKVISLKLKSGESSTTPARFILPANSFPFWAHTRRLPSTSAHSHSGHGTRVSEAECN